MPHLFDPLTIKDITLRNRIGLPPMCMYSYIDGFSNDWQLVHLGARAAGGAGLIIAEATAVEARGRITPFDIGLWNDEQIAPLARVTRFIQQQGTVPGIQIAHAGRKACTGKPWEGGKPLQPGEALFWQAVAPSTLPFAEGYQTPSALSLDEIHHIQGAFAAAAGRALLAGFQWLELHAAHGYLMHSFLSPLCNQRTDAYGGSFENRTRFLLETLRRVRTTWPERLPLTVRVSGTDWVECGWTLEETVELARRMKAEGVDLVDCSSGGAVPQAKPPVGAGYQVPIAEAVRKGAGIRTAAVGLITSPMQADEIIRNERADLVLVGREMLRDPHWPLQAARALKQPLPMPPQYHRAY